jgi:hypothetical protein
MECYLIKWSSFHLSGHFIKWSFHQMANLIKCFHQMVISSNGHFIKWSFHQMVISSNGHFIKWSFQQMVTSSNCHFIKSDHFIKWPNDSTFSVSTIELRDKSTYQVIRPHELLVAFRTKKPFFSRVGPSVSLQLIWPGPNVIKPFTSAIYECS